MKSKIYYPHYPGKEYPRIFGGGPQMRNETLDGSVRSITMNKDDLLKKLEANKVKHVKEYLSMKKDYKEQVIEELQSTLDMIKDDKKSQSYFDLHFNIPHPTNYERNYILVIEMLKAAQETEFKLTDSDFKKYVLDEWDWKENHAATQSFYAANKLS